MRYRVSTGILNGVLLGMVMAQSGSLSPGGLASNWQR